MDKEEKSGKNLTVLLDSDIDYKEMRRLAGERRNPHAVKGFEYIFDKYGIRTYKDLLHFIKEEGLYNKQDVGGLENYRRGEKGLQIYRKIGPKSAQLLYAHLTSKGVNFEEWFNNEESEKTE